MAGISRQGHPFRPGSICRKCGRHVINFAAQKNLVCSRVRLEAVGAKRNEIPDEREPEVRQAEGPAAISQEKRMMISAHAAPIHGLASEVTAILAMMDVRNALSAASTTPNGLSKIRMLMALDARNTMKNAAIAMGIIRAL